MIFEVYLAHLRNPVNHPRLLAELETITEEKFVFFNDLNLNQRSELFYEISVREEPFRTQFSDALKQDFPDYFEEVVQDARPHLDRVKKRKFLEYSRFLNSSDQLINKKFFSPIDYALVKEQPLKCIRELMSKGISLNNVLRLSISYETKTKTTLQLAMDFGREDVVKLCFLQKVPALGTILDIEYAYRSDRNDFIALFYQYNFEGAVTQFFNNNRNLLTEAIRTSDLVLLEILLRYNPRHHLFSKELKPLELLFDMHPGEERELNVNAGMGLDSNKKKICHAVKQAVRDFVMDKNMIDNKLSLM